MVVGDDVAVRVPDEAAAAALGLHAGPPKHLQAGPAGGDVHHAGLGGLQAAPLRHLKPSRQPHEAGRYTCEQQYPEAHDWHDSLVWMTSDDSLPCNQVMRQGQMRAQARAAPGLHAGEQVPVINGGS